MKVSVFNFSGALGEQGFLEYLEGKPFELIDCADIEGTHCYCDAGAREALDFRLEGVEPLRWLDSGDYHYLSHLLALKETEPFHLVLLDHHPDNQAPAFEGVLSCGSWVRALQEESRQLRDVLTIGPEGCPQDIPQGWLEERRGERVYVSLDKDILSRNYARTDWTQGEYTPEEVEAILQSLAAGMEIVALDICGELSLAQGARAEDLRINRETNIALYKFITNHFELCQR